ncbi:hypothetical protein MNBD_BACTEROID01-952 [hydrothermal vent metagenome]|uniref:Uncharacterized protein n=1 Tax=hydrothermal vent metagenome TaxID=652676 RepID=A0A3B0TRR7_9ZZZZ
MKEASEYTLYPSQSLKKPDRCQFFLFVQTKFLLIVKYYVEEQLKQFK